MTKSNLQEAVINYAIDMCATAIRVGGINAVIDGDNIVEISKRISEIKQINYDMLEDIMNDYEYSVDQRLIANNTLERESAVAAMSVKHYYDNYRRDK